MTTHNLQYMNCKTTVSQLRHKKMVVLQLICSSSNTNPQEQTITGAGNAGGRDHDFSSLIPNEMSRYLPSKKHYNTNSKFS